MHFADSHASLKKKRVRGNSAPWITPNLKNLTFQRDKLKKLASRSQNHTDWKNLVNYTIKAARVEYYDNYFKENSTNIHNTWKGIKTMMGNEAKSTTIKGAFD